MLNSKGKAGRRSDAVLFGGDGDQLLGSLGDVIGALDDLLGDQLCVGHRPPLWHHCCLAFALQPEGARGEQAQGASHRLRARPLGGVGVEDRVNNYTLTGDTCMSKA